MICVSCCQGNVSAIKKVITKNNVELLLGVPSQDDVGSFFNKYTYGNGEKRRLQSLQITRAETVLDPRRYNWPSISIFLLSFHYPNSFMGKRRVFVGALIQKWSMAEGERPWDKKYEIW